MTDLTTRIAVAIHGATPPNPDAALALHRDAAERVLPVVEAEVARLRAAVEDEGHFVAPDCYGDLTIWRDRGDRPPLAVMSSTRLTEEAFTLAARGLEVRA